MLIPRKIQLILSLILIISFKNVKAHTDPVKDPIIASTTKEVAEVTLVELNIFPNPNHGTFYITVINDESYQAHLYALDGRLVKSIYLNSGLNYVSINVPAGIYLLEIGDEEEKQQFKIDIK